MKLVRSGLDLLRAILASNPGPVPWPHMLICGMATTVPVVAGYLNGELGLAIYGALAGYLVAINDHFGALAHRMLIATLSFAGLTGAFAIGLGTHDQPLLFAAVVAVLTYWLGLMGGTGFEVERLLLFSILEIVVVHYAPRMPGVAAGASLGYGALAYAVILAGQLLSDRFARRHRNQGYARLRPSLTGSLTRQAARHRFAIEYLVATGLAVYAVERFRVERGYWMVITVLLVMRPKLRDSLYRHLQRLIGTLCGVTIGEVLITLIDRRAVLISGVFVASFFVPYGLKRNYWLVSFFATIMVVLFLTLPAPGPGAGAVPFLRLVATGWGCAIGLGVTLVSAGVQRLLRRDRR